VIPVARPWLGEEEAEAARRVLLSGWVTQGPEVAAFEAEFAGHVGATHACAVSSCTAALHLALKAVGVGPGDDVLTVSHSFIATANSVRYCGARPVFVDVSPETLNLDPSLVEDSITSRTRALLCAHQVGMPCDLGALSEIARRRSLPLIEDAACAAGSEILWNGEWEKIGRPHGDIACFSFHPRKLLTTGDGGMLTTASAELDSRFRLWRQHSMDVSDTVRHASGRVIFEEYPELGYNYRLTDLQAAVGREQLKRLPQVISDRRRLAERYQRMLGALPGVSLQHQPGWARSNWQSFCVRLPEKADQRHVMQSLADAGVSSRRGVMCAHREPAYAQEPWAAAPSGLRQSELAQDTVVILPLYQGMTEDEQAEVVEALAAALKVGSQAAATAASARL
jgi:dTDP-4-amino-4,6-dideoxygalactose transaminase